ncbi:MAG TPA: S-layer homology domain-containing protein [Acidimicrobiia bacterium]|nr:S-layer homology domain-containing protein [Acidimicrobiia bacterium]
MRLGLRLVLTSALVLVLATTALAAGTITRVSEAADGSGGGANIGELAVSDDGRFVAFRSDSTNLVPGDTNGRLDVFVKDTQTGAIERVNVSSSGQQANHVSGASIIDMSSDGRYVIFESTATNLVAGDTNGLEDMFIRDRQTGTTTRLLRDDGTQGMGSVNDGAISGNGRFVAMVAAGHTAGGPTGLGVYVTDLQTGDVERLMDAISVYESVDISDDGRYVVFTTREFNNDEDLILYDRNTDTWEVANPRIGGQAPQSRIGGNVSISGNGRFVAFGSGDTNYVAGDPPATVDVFVYDSNSGSLQRIPSLGPNNNSHPRPVISDTGQFVAFAARGDIYDPPPGNGQMDAVVYDRNAGIGEVVSKFDDGSLSNSASALAGKLAISGNGRFVTFFTTVAFDADDTTGSDVYIVDRQGTAGPPPGPDGRFVDDNGHIFENAIEWLAGKGITEGCNPPTNDRFCPNDPVTRGEMAVFLVRAFGYSDNGGGNLFVDDDGLFYENSADRLFTAGVTQGCNPPTNNRYCGEQRVTRGQMAAFLTRAFNLPAYSGPDRFRDDDGNIFEGAIERLAQAGITVGCNPPANDRFCPDQSVTRGQMATFLKRAFGE